MPQQHPPPSRPPPSRPPPKPMCRLLLAKLWPPLPSPQPPWRISKVIYGSGVKYTLLYEANKDQIRDANRIYPGQVFKTPDVVPPETIDPKQREPLSPALGEASGQ